MGSLYGPECGNEFATPEERRGYGSTDLGFLQGMDCPECFDGTLELTAKARLKQADSLQEGCLMAAFCTEPCDHNACFYLNPTEN